MSSSPLISDQVSPHAHSAGGAPGRRTALLVAGMSHIEALRRAWPQLSVEHPEVTVDFVDLRTEGAIAQFGRCAAHATGIALLVDGNEHTVVGIAQVEPLDAALRTLETKVEASMTRWLDRLVPQCPLAPVLLLPPPPICDVAPIIARKHAQQATAGTAALVEQLEKHGLRAAEDRRALWRQQCDLSNRIAQSRGLRCLALPAGVFSDEGMLAAECCGETDITHGNTEYGRRVLAHWLGDIHTARAQTAPPSHPYRGLPDHQYWAQGVAAGGIDPVVAPRFLVAPRDLLATAGSCFAQHLARHLRAGGFEVMSTEPATAEDGADDHFSARYGNIYTARQLRQLLERALGRFQPVERAWRRTDGRYCDPFRPSFHPAGFDTPAEVEAAAARHLSAVARMFRELDVFVFTLGLTECWSAREDGAVYPVAPGVVAGEYRAERHVFSNLGYEQVMADMEAFLQGLWSLNPRARVLLSVSPVSLVATQEPRHVLVANGWSKAVLRTVAGALRERHAQVEYFPSYEIVTGPQARGRYFAEDARQVNAEGVAEVMRVFMSHMTPGEPGKAARDTAAAYDLMQAAADVLCDEERYLREADPQVPL